jgi:hypothetical protein
LEYLGIAEAARILLSRIAFADDPSQLQTVIQVFCEVYEISNKFLALTLEELELIVRASIVLSIYKRPGKGMSQADFTSVWLSKLRFSGEYKARLYQDADKHPIIVFFMFAPTVAPISLNLTGILNKVEGSFKRKTPRYFAIEGGLLKFYKDATSGVLLGEIDLQGTVTKCIRGAGKKEEPHLLLKKRDNSPLGYKIKKGVKKKSEHTEYVFYAGDKTPASAWEWSCNTVAFLTLLSDLGEKMH